jgi:hypothetical protein
MPEGAAAVSDERELWGIGAYETDQGIVSYPATPAEMARHIDTAEARLRTLGVIHDDVVVLVGRGSEAIQFAPWEHAVNRLGAAYAVVDGFSSDSHRLAAYVSQFAPRAVLGLVQDVAAGAERDLSIRELLGETPAVAARPGAYALMRAQGLEPLLWLHAGPAVAVECGFGSGAHLDGAWQPEIVDGRLVLHPHADQRLPSVIPTGVVASVETERCRCGSDDPRLRLGSVSWAD